MITLQKTVCTILRNLGLALKVTKFAISSRGLRLWNKYLDNNTKAFTPSSLFQTAIKYRLINLENVVLFF